MCGGIELSDALRRPDSNSKSGMHRNGNRDQVALADFLFRERFYGQICYVGRESGLFQKPCRHGDREGLMSQFIAGKEKDLLHARSSFFPACRTTA